MKDQELQSLLNVVEAERITGVSYKESEETSGLGFMISMLKSQQLRTELQARDDVAFGATGVADYIRIIKSEGFEQVLCTPFHSNRHNIDAEQFIFWNPEGILLVFDTFHGLNSAKFYYNIKFHCENRWDYTSSGTMYGDENDENVWVGDHDGRTAFRFNLKNLRDNGTFLKTWIRQPFLWLLHYGDTENEDYDRKKINAERIALLPAHVQEAIKGTMTDTDKNMFKTSAKP